MSKDKVIGEVKNALELAGLSYGEIVVYSYEPGNFGNSEIIVDCSIGTLKIVRDRGKTFIDILDSHGVYVPCEKKYPSVDAIQKAGTWSLLDQLKAIKQA